MGMVGTVRNAASARRKSVSVDLDLQDLSITITVRGNLPCRK